MADTAVLGTVAARRGGSSPLSGTFDNKVTTNDNKLCHPMSYYVILVIFNDDKNVSLRL